MANHIQIENGSLAEHLYSFFSLEEVQNMLAQQPEPYELTAWDLSIEEYVQQLNSAIALIKSD